MSAATAAVAANDGAPLAPGHVDRLTIYERTSHIARGSLAQVLCSVRTESIDELFYGDRTLCLTTFEVASSFRPGSISDRL